MKAEVLIDKLRRMADKYGCIFIGEPYPKVIGHAYNLSTHLPELGKGNIVATATKEVGVKKLPREEINRYWYRVKVE
jgi:hypothetical protein